MRGLAMMFTTVAICVACASTPDRIPAASVSDAPYLNLTCEQLGEESQRVKEALASASEKQQKASDNDMLGVFLIGMPVSSMSGGDIAPEIARLKGEREAVERVRSKNNCG